MSWLFEHFETMSSNVVMAKEEQLYTYGELLQEIKSLESMVSLIPSGKVVAILSDYSFKSIALLLALYANKNIIVPITSTNDSEIQSMLEESFCDVVIEINGEYKVEQLKNSTTHDMLENLRELNHSGLVLFSSGSTGKPKAMIHDFDVLINHFKDKKHRKTHMLLFLMFDHIGGLNTLLNILAMGATMIIPLNRNAEHICALIQKYKIRVLPSSPTFLNLIVMSGAYEKYSLNSLRMITYGTEVMPESLLSKLKELFPKVKFLQTFGTSETGIATTFSKSSDSTFMKIDDPDLEYKIVNDELWLKSNTQVMGYLNASMESFEDGWFKTGDLVTVTDDGFIKIIGRNKEVINVGGQKVLPAEIESVVLTMEEVKDCMVYGEKNSITGQTVVCDIVVADASVSKNMKKEIRKYCKSQLESYKLPTKVNVVKQTNFGSRFKKIRAR